MKAAIAGAVFAALGFDRDDPGVRAEFMQDPDVRGNARRQVQDTLRNILGYRIYYDLRRGWRFNNPNLEQLGLLRIAYRDLGRTVERRRNVAGGAARPASRLADGAPAHSRDGLRAMRQGLCLASRYLDRAELDRLKTASYANLREPWGFSEDEQPVAANWFITVGQATRRRSPQRRIPRFRQCSLQARPPAQAARHLARRRRSG
ncbi:MAG: hypothetical protein V5B34_04645 [Accumulibacter sp.]